MMLTVTGRPIDERLVNVRITLLANLAKHGLSITQNILLGKKIYSAYKYHVL
jgi:hypothetical protein